MVVFANEKIPLVRHGVNEVFLAMVIFTHLFAWNVPCI